MRIPPAQVHVWTAALDGAFDGGSLSAAERDRFARLPAAVGRRRAAARAFLRRLLGGLLDLRPADVPLSVLPGGKPVLPGDPFHFSLSHAAGTAVVAVAADRPVGVDVEDGGRPLDVPSAAEFLSGGEAARLAALPEDVRRDAFFRLWTAEEARRKRAGTGWSAPAPDPAADRVDTWSFAGGWIASVAAPGAWRRVDR